MTRKTHFGYKEVEENQKETLVQGVFSSVAKKYDIMNDIMSFGMHRLWKARLIKTLFPYHNKELLDVAGGTGDVSIKFIEAGGQKATVCDLNLNMLQEGQRRVKGTSHIAEKQFSWLHCNAEALEVKDESYDYCVISFGVRNFTNIPKGLTECYRILKPGGKFVCLEFSNVNDGLLKSIYDFYSFNVIPKIGQIVAQDSESYQYLVESIRKFPTSEQFALMLEKAGFDQVSFVKMSQGIVALHTGYKPI